MRTLIEIIGCDDKTEFVMDLDEQQFRFVERLASVTRLIGGGCRPTIIVGRDFEYRDFQPMVTIDGTEYEREAWS